MAKKKRSGLLRLEGEMNIYKAEDIRHQMLNMVESGGALKIDLSQVSEIDCSGVQLLIASRKAAIEKEKEWQIVAQSEAIGTTLSMLGLGHLLTTSAKS